MVYYIFFSIIVSICLTFITIYFKLFYKDKRFNELIDKIPGPKSRYPLFGNLDLFMKNACSQPKMEVLHRIPLALSHIYKNEGIFKFSFGFKYSIFIFNKDTAQELLQNKENIDKPEEYMLLKDWLGTGLLTSGGSLWRERRKMITNAFHSKIIDDFIPVFNKHSKILQSIFQNSIEKEFVDIQKLITACVLDIICETALGLSINAQQNPNLEYVNAILRVCHLYIQRVQRPWLWPDLTYFLTKNGKQFRKDVKFLHEVTDDVIKKALNEHKSYDNNESDVNNSENKKRLPFLELLLNNHFKDKSLTLEDIREEVDTFMFEGHDSTSVALSWNLYLLGLYPDIQYRIQEELDSIFGDEKDREITKEDVKQMHYLESVIKESMRLYPSVPLIARKVSVEMKAGNYIIPKGVTVMLMIDQLHMDSDEFPNPLEFIPERFSKENSRDRNPFSFTPFSAGPRNCIAQKFALLEVKIILSKIFLKFNVKSLDKRDKVINTMKVVNRSISPLRIKIKHRI